MTIDKKPENVKPVLALAGRLDTDTSPEPAALAPCIEALLG